MVNETTTKGSEKRQSVSRRETWVIVGCVGAATSVALGAIGAHMIEAWLTSQAQLEVGPVVDVTKRLATWETAARYQMYHSLGLIALGLTTTIRNSLRHAAGWTMLAGMLLFSGCLYGYVITDIKTLVHIVPFGGLCFILSWLLFACGFFIRDRDSD